MRFYPLLGALLLSAAPVFAEIQFTCCIENKDSQIQEAEKELQMGVRFSQDPDSVALLVNQLEEAGQFAVGLSQEEKNSEARKFMNLSIKEMQRKLEIAKKYPDCSEIKRVQQK